MPVNEGLTPSEELPSKAGGGQNGAFMPDGERGSGLGDRSHGGEFPN